MSERDKKLNLSIKSFTAMSKKKKIAFSIIAVSLMVSGSLFAFFYITNVNNQQYHNPEIDLNVYEQHKYINGMIRKCL